MVNYPRILIVDDEDDIRTTTKTILGSENYKIITAKNGDECLKKLKQYKVDLILLDIMMPGTPAKEIIKKASNTNIAFFSVIKASDTEKENLLSHPNVVGFIQKPFDIYDLINKVKLFVEKKPVNS